ncbi:MAG: hypothetical protein AAGC84_16805 [Pseudomonas sp.]
MRWMIAWVSTLALAAGGVHAEPSAATLHQWVCQAVVETVMQQDSGASRQLAGAAVHLDHDLRSKVLAFDQELSQVARLVQPGEPLPAERLASFSRVLNDLLRELQPRQSQGALSDLPERVEFLTLLYVARNEIGALRPAREWQGSYLGLDITELAQSIDAQMQQFDGQTNSANLQDALTRWRYIRSQFLHYKTLPPSSLSVSRQGQVIAQRLRDERSDQVGAMRGR